MLTGAVTAQVRGGGAPAASVGRPRVEVVEVADRAGLRDFVRLPATLYAGDPLWVPPLLREDERFLSRRNPYLRGNPTRLFLARRSGRTVGRIAASVCRRHNAEQREKTGFFGFFECDGEAETAAALLDAAGAYLQGEGMEVLRGPFNLTTNHTCGLLIEGYDGPPRVEMPYNPRRYAELLEDCGLRKAKDLLAHWIDLRGTSEPQLELAEIARRAPAEYRVREMGLRGAALTRDLEIFFDLYHHAWRNNWGFVPLEQDEYDYLFERVRPVLQPGLSFVAEADGRPAGMFIGIPDFNQILPLLKGRLTPLGVARAWFAQRRIDAARYLLTGIYDRFRGTPAAALLLHHCLEGARARGCRGVEISWVLEDNAAANRFFRKYGARVYRRYRIYEGSLR